MVSLFSRFYLFLLTSCRLKVFLIINRGFSCLRTQIIEIILVKCLRFFATLSLFVLFTFKFDQIIFKKSHLWLSAPILLFQSSNFLILLPKLFLQLLETLFSLFFAVFLDLLQALQVSSQVLQLLETSLEILNVEVFCVSAPRQVFSVLDGVVFFLVN